MKIRFIAILAALLLAFSITACGNNNTEESTTGDKININGEQSGNSTNDSNGNQNEETTSGMPVVDRVSDPGDVTYVEKNDTVYVINKLNSVAFRGGKMESLGEFKNGDVLQRTAISEDGRWSKVTFNGVEGYIATRNLTSYNPASNNFESCELTLTVTKDKTINVRISPEVPTGIDYNDPVEVDFNVAGQIFEGHTIKVIAVDNASGWYKIEYTPASGALVAGYNYEFFIKADSSLFVSAQGNGAN